VAHINFNRPTYCVQCARPTLPKYVQAQNGGAGIHRPWMHGPLCDLCREAWVACLIEEGKRMANAPRIILP
jgi:hypothetical protein